MDTHFPLVIVAIALLGGVGAHFYYVGSSRRATKYGLEYVIEREGAEPVYHDTVICHIGILGRFGPQILRTTVAVFSDRVVVSGYRFKGSFYYRIVPSAEVRLSIAGGTWPPIVLIWKDSKSRRRLSLLSQNPEPLWAALAKALEQGSGRGEK